MSSFNSSEQFTAFNKMRVLIVDDFENFRMSMKKILLSFGVEKVDVTKNGNEAVRACTEAKYDLILCDYNLGQGKNGQQVLEELRHLKLLKNTDIFIIVTADSSKEVVMSAVENQPDEYLTKPFSQSVFKKRLQSTMEQKKSVLNINEALDRKDYPEAIQFCAQEISKKSKFSSWCFKTMVNLYFLEGKLTLARHLYSQSIAKRGTVWASIGLAKVEIADKNYETAELICQNIITNDSMNLAAHELLAIIFEKKRELKKAQRSLEFAVEISPLNILRQNKLGEVCVENLDIERAMVAYRNAVSLGEFSCHHSPDAYLNFCRCLTDICDSDKSKHGKALFSEALEVLKLTSKKYGNLAEVKIQSLLVEVRALSGQGYNQKALEVLDKAQTLCDLPENTLLPKTKLELARSFYSVGLGEKAEKVLNELAEEHQSDKTLQKVISEMLEEPYGYKKKIRARHLNKTSIKQAKEGDYSAAIATLKLAITETPNHTGLNLNLVQSQLQQFQQSPPSSEDIALCKSCIQKVSHIEEGHKQFKRLASLTKKVNKLVVTASVPSN
jgi:CheY-like chemotaxis protein/Tfp pilus assembly protein PilF